MVFKSKKDFLFLILACFFVTNAIVAEMISSKLIDIGPFTMIVGIIPWPVVFLSTDIINEFYGKSAVQRLSVITCCMIAYAFIVLFIAMHVKTSPVSPASGEEFNKVFGNSLWVIIGSITAFMVSQVLDVRIFWLIRNITGEKMIWLRSTGSTVISQLIDSYVVLGIGFWLPGKFTFHQFLVFGITGYCFKLIIAVCLTPVIYFMHGVIKNYLGEEAAEAQIKHTAEESLHHKVEN
ncbi:MAG: queuosine precursor transporter [Bacteroidia bacterium]